MGSKFNFRRLIIRFLPVTALTLVSSPSIVFGYAVRPDHPRLFLTNDNIPQIRNKIQTQFREEFQEFIDEADARINGDKSINRYYTTIQNLAFIYMMGELPGFTYGHNIDEYASYAKELLMAKVDEFIATGTFPTERGTSSWTNHYLHAASVVYDWLHPLLTRQEKEKIVNILVQEIEDLNSVYFAPLGHGDGIGCVKRFIGALAFYGDGIDDAFAQTVLDKFYTEFLGDRGTLTLKDKTAAEDGGTNSGTAVYLEFFYKQIALVAGAWYSATGENVFTNSSYLEKLPYFLLYTTRAFPVDKSNQSTDGYRYTLYHDARQNSDDSISANDINLRMGQSVYKSLGRERAELALWIIDRRAGLRYLWYDHLYSLFIYDDKTIPATSPSELGLPLTQHFQGLGLVVARQGFEDINDTVITFKAMPWAYKGGYWSSHNQGHFDIEKYALLTMHAGSGGHNVYEANSISSNVILFVDWTNEDDGGNQRKMSYPPVRSVDDLVPQSKFDIGGIKRIETYDQNNTYDYIFADLTRAYNSSDITYPGQTPKVEKYTRQFIYLRPQSKSDRDYVIVYDRAKSTKPEIEKKWLLHMSYEPEINGTGIPEREGKTVYEGADLVTITNTYQGEANQAHGRLFSKTLLPQNPKIVKIGGPNHEFEDIYGNNIMDGSHLTSPISDRDAYFAGSYRIEVIPSTPQRYDIFLHVLQTADTNKPEQSSKMVQTELVDGNTMEGAHIAASPGQHEWITMFSKTEENQDQVIYQVPTWSDSIYHLIADLDSLTYYNVYQNEQQLTTKPTSDAGTLHFKSLQGGTFQITKGAPLQLPQIQDIDPDTIKNGLTGIQLKGQYFTESISKIEIFLGNRARKADCTVLIKQTVESVNDSIAQFTCRTEAQIEGKINYIYVETQNGLHNYSGYPVFVKAPLRFTPGISSVSNLYILPSDSILQISGNHFTPLPAKIELTDHPDYNSSSIKQVQQIVASTDTSVQVRLNLDGLTYGQYYLFISNGQFVRNQVGFELWYWNDSWIPEITDVSPSDSLSFTQQEITLLGRYFGYHFNLCQLEITDHIDYEGSTEKQQQSITALSDSSIKFELQLNGFSYPVDTLYVFVTNPAGLRNLKGFPLSFSESNFETVIPNDRFVLYQNFPNPFNDTSEIHYYLPSVTDQTNWYLVSLNIYNYNGQLTQTLVKKIQGPGDHKIVWNGDNMDGEIVSSGVYFYVLKVNDDVYLRKKMVFLK